MTERHSGQHNAPACPMHFFRAGLGVTVLHAIQVISRWKGIFKKIFFIYLTEREHKQGEQQAEREGAPMRKEPKAGFNPRTLGLWPKLKVDCQPTKPPRHLQVKRELIDMQRTQIKCAQSSGLPPLEMAYLQIQPSHKSPLPAHLWRPCEDRSSREKRTLHKLSKDLDHNSIKYQPWDSGGG